MREDQNTEKSYVLKGNICYSENKDTIHAIPNGYAVCVDGVSQGVFSKLPQQYQNLNMIDCKDHLIIPGITDLHVHAPQYQFRGLGMDMELLDWLNTHTFPEEAKYREMEYAKKSYQMFVDELKNGATTRACIFATIHLPATKLLMDLMEESGLVSFVGKVNMDRNSPDYLVEETSESAQNTRTWIEDAIKRYQNTFPILTPRFTPSCSDELMRELSEIQKEYHLPVQSHLSENYSEIAWVQELCPNTEFYGDAYDQFGMFGGDTKTVMAHCVHSGEAEQHRIRERGVFIAHCPESNINLASGVAPVKKYLQDGQKIGLGSDVAGGSTTSMFVAMRQAIQASKLRWRLKDESLRPLTVAEVFYMATKGGGEFFGKVGSLEKGYAFDALVIDDGKWNVPGKYQVADRLERMIYLADEQSIVKKYVDGRQIIDR